MNSEDWQAQIKADYRWVEISIHLERWLGWYRMRRAINWSGYGLSAGLLISFIISAWLLIQGQLLRGEFIGIILLSGVLGAFIAGMLGYGWSLSRQKAVRYFDRVFHLKERLSTAYELNFGTLATITPPLMIKKQMIRLKYQSD